VWLRPCEFKSRHPHCFFKHLAHAPFDQPLSVASHTVVVSRPCLGRPSEFGGSQPTAPRSAGSCNGLVNEHVGSGPCEKLHQLQPLRRWCLRGLCWLQLCWALPRNATGAEAAGGARKALVVLSAPLARLRRFWRLPLESRRLRPRPDPRGGGVWGGDQFWTVLLSARWAIATPHLRRSGWARWPRWKRSDRREMGAEGRFAPGSGWRPRARWWVTWMADFFSRSPGLRSLA